MDNRSDIWRRLQDHQTPPPPEVFDRLQQLLESDTPGRLERLQDHALLPPSSVQEAIRKQIAVASQGRPQEPGDLDKPGSPHKSGRLHRLRSSGMFYGAAAACIIVAIGLTLYQVFISRKPLPSGIDRHAIVHSPVAPVSKSRTEDTTSVAAGSPATDTNATASANAAASATDSLTSTRITKGARSFALTINNHPLPLVDNDLLVTLTSFTYPEIADYVNRREDQVLKVHLDQYTNIVVSRQAAGMIREMYKTRSNGKPTRKARKVKEKLEGWKKADERRFDGTAPFNPADPFDLGDFIFR